MRSLMLCRSERLIVALLYSLAAQFLLLPFVVQSNLSSSHLRSNRALWWFRLPDSHVSWLFLIHLPSSHHDADATDPACCRWCAHTVAGLCMDAPILVLCALMLYHINFVSTINFHAGL